MASKVKSFFKRTLRGDDYVEDGHIEEEAGDVIAPPSEPTPSKKTKFDLEHFDNPAKLREGSSLHSIQGKRQSMEDQHLVATYDDLEMYGVFDGHGGDDVVKFVANHLANALLPPFEAREKQGGKESDLKAVVESVYKDLDQLMFEKRFDAGCCALVAIFDKQSNDMWVINLGDSKALLFRDDCKQLLETFEKTPADPEERQRIEQADSKVTKKPHGVERIDGRLAVSRAFGDIEFKTPHENSTTYTPNKGPVSVMPFFHHVKLSNNTYYLVLACDGLWFDGGILQPFTNDEIMRCVSQNKMDAAALVNEAYGRGSGDNITCMVVKFSL